jgi:hypothetical protein
MTEESGRSSPRRARAIGPFAVFGAVAVLAAIGAVFEISYWVGTPATAPSVLGTALGIGAALVGFFVWGLRAPANE